MQVSVDTVDGLKRSLKIAVPAQQVEDQIKNRLQNLARTARIAGFRPGKIPMGVVEKRFGGAVRQEVLGEVLEKSFRDAVVQEKLTPATGPRIETLCAEPGKDLEYRAEFEIYPEIRLKAVEELELVVPDASITDADLNNAIESLRQGHSEWVEVDRPAADGDQVVLDFTGTIEGAAFTGGSAQNVRVNVGAGRFLPEFEQNVSGISKGQDVRFDLTFPQDYASSEVAGKTAQFSLHAHSVNEAKLPDLDEAFAKKLGIQEGGIDKLRQLVRESLQDRLQNALRDEKRQLTMNVLHDANPVELPEGLVRQESEHLLQETLARQKSFKEARAPLTAEDFAGQAKRRVALSLILGEIIKSNKLEADQTRVRELVYSVAQSAPNPEEVVRYYFSDKRRLRELESIALEEKVVEWVLEHAKIRTEQKTYAEVTVKV